MDRWSSKSARLISLQVLVIALICIGAREVEAHGSCIGFVTCIAQTRTKFGPCVEAFLCLQPLMEEPPQFASNGCRNACALSTATCEINCAYNYSSGAAGLAACIDGCVKANGSCVDSCGSGDRVQPPAPPPGRYRHYDPED